MKWIAIAILLVGIILCAGCTSTNLSTPGQSTPVATPSTMKSIPDLIGKWSGNSTGHTTVEGFFSHPTFFNISEQKGQAFSGRKEYLRGDGKMYYENLSGIITMNGEIYESDGVAGFSIGRLTGPDSLEFNYLEDGSDNKAYITRLSRQKT
ncbi:MAG: hypothetical protein NTV68_02225 [Methanomicrobiales archaeon]|nr:hypothetical protein [Methanomicrobiales archaeon]